ncbi:hypothetical protein BDW59DRAFT_66118 [Aspergillus cavernicola]|uniref:Cytochrome P450 n=1 Tax=Aspergillus cavernicola TaxID=176166 RepID=A0ABR4IEN4_9EURO
MVKGHLSSGDLEFDGRSPLSFQNCSGRAFARPMFCLLTPAGTQYVLSPKFAHEISSHPGLIPGEFQKINLTAHIAGFEVLQQVVIHHVVQDAVRTKLTRMLTKLTKPLSTEAAILLKQQWTDDPDWHEISPSATAVYIVSRLSSIVFVGDEIGRNPEWLKIVTNYSAEFLGATHDLMLWSEQLRPLVAHFSPSCRRLRQTSERQKPSFYRLSEKGPEQRYRRVRFYV